MYGDTGEYYPGPSGYDVAPSGPSGYNPSGAGTYGTVPASPCGYSGGYGYEPTRPEETPASLVNLSLTLAHGQTPRTVRLTTNNTWGVYHRIDYLPWLCVNGVNPPSEAELSNFAERCVEVLSAFPDFVDSNFTCFSDYLCSTEGSLQDTRTLPGIASATVNNTFPDPYRCISTKFHCLSRFAGYPVEIIADLEGISITVNGRTLSFNDILGYSMHIGHFCCIGGMVHVINALHMLLRILKNPPECVGYPLYSCKHQICPAQNYLYSRCLNCFAVGYLDSNERDAQAIPTCFWKDHPASKPATNSLSLLLDHRAKLETLFWSFMPYQLGKLACTCRTFRDFFGKESYAQWKTFILSTRPYLLHQYEDFLSEWAPLSLPKIISKISPIIPFDPAYVTEKTTGKTPVIGFLQQRSATDFVLLTLDQLKSLNFLKRQGAQKFYEISCFNWCQTCRKEITDPGSTCGRHNGVVESDCDEYGSFYRWTCCGSSDPNDVYCPSKSCVVPHHPVAGVDEYIKKWRG